MSWCLSQRTRTARKEHSCFFCGESIPVGTRYGSRAGASDGEFWFIKFHPECSEATNSWRDDDYEVFTEGMLIRGTDVERQYCVGCKKNKATVVFLNNPVCESCKNKAIDNIEDCDGDEL